MLSPSTDSNRCAVAIITDVRLYREGLARLLAGNPDLDILGTWSPADDLPSWGADLQNCVLVVDSAAVRSSELVPRLAQAMPQAKVVAFAVTEEDEEEIIACAEAGVAGFVARNASTDELVAVILSAARGDLRCSPRVAAVVVRRIAQLRALRWARPAQSCLTPREAQVVALIDAGLSNKGISRQLGVEIATVKNHVHNILEKLHVRRRAEAAAFVRAQRRWASNDLVIGRLPA